jgi:hypothetical protein
MFLSLFRLHLSFDKQQTNIGGVHFYKPLPYLCCTLHGLVETSHSLSHRTSASITPSPSPSGCQTLLTWKPASPSNARHSASLLCDPECMNSIAMSSPLCRSGTFSSGRMMSPTSSLLYPGNIAFFRCFKISRQTGDAQLCRMFCRKYTLAPVHPESECDGLRSLKKTHLELVAA